MAYATSSERPLERVSLERPLAGPALSFDLGFEVARLRQETAWNERGHNARTLAKYPDTRVVLAVMKAGTRMRTHATDERMTIQPLFGHVRAWLPFGKSFEVNEDGLLVLDRAVVEEIESIEESAFLLTITWTR